METSNYVVATAIVFFVVCASIVVFLIAMISKGPSSTPNNGKRNGTCGIEQQHTCGAMDPVSDPAYNMKNVIKQSILLEEHLAEDRKYCKDCVCKHFLHIIALIEEALMLSGKDATAYPNLRESHAFYETSYNDWTKNKENETVRRELVTLLRDWRKNLMRQYLL